MYICIYIYTQKILWLQTPFKSINYRYLYHKPITISSCSSPPWLLANLPAIPHRWQPCLVSRLTLPVSITDSPRMKLTVVANEILCI